VLSQPAVTCVIPGTTKVANLETNVRAARGALPDAVLRRQMEDEWERMAI
jgi:aryl-alcohol dehydrogenase-like predicted oxidoreductase